MASKFVVAVVLFAVCHSSPVIRDARSYGIGFSTGPIGVNKATATATKHKAEANGSNDHGAHVARDGFGYALPGQAFAKASTDDSPDETVGAKILPAYYPVPAPATVQTYQQYADVPETPSQIVYGPALAQSSATTNNGGYADSNANVDRNNAVSNARVHGNGYGTASSVATNSGIVNPVPGYELLEPTITDAKAQKFNTVYTPVQSGYGAASSNANVNAQYGSATSSAKTGAVPARKSISWRFGTAYDNPASYFRSGPSHIAYNSANANANVNYGQGVAKSAAQINGAGSGSANSNVNSNGYANANADVKNAGYEVFRSVDNSGFVSTAANSNDFGTANADADINAFGIKSAANTNGNGSAKSTANNGSGYGFRSNGWGSGAGDRISADSHTSGFGSASAKTQGLSTGYRVVDTNVNSHNSGSARANAYST